jgi:ammonia channel protein AmtB
LLSLATFLPSHLTIFVLEFKITAGCATLELWADLVTGLIAGLLYLWTSGLLIRFKIDDAVDAIPGKQL